MSDLKDRTQPGETTSNLSEEGVDPQYLSDFRDWRTCFRNKLYSEGAVLAWNTLLEAHCEAGDLEWALFRAVDEIDTASHLQAELKAFARCSLKVLDKIGQLRPALARLMTFEILEQPAWYVWFGFFKFPVREALRFQKFPLELQ